MRSWLRILRFLIVSSVLVLFPVQFMGDRGVAKAAEEFKDRLVFVVAEGSHIFLQPGFTGVAGNLFSVKQDMTLGVFVTNIVMGDTLNVVIGNVIATGFGVEQEVDTTITLLNGTIDETHRALLFRSDESGNGFFGATGLVVIASAVGEIKDGTGRFENSHGVSDFYLKFELNLADLSAPGVVHKGMFLFEFD